MCLSSPLGSRFTEIVLPEVLPAASVSLCSDGHSAAQTRGRTGQKFLALWLKPRTGVMRWQRIAGGKIYRL